MSIILDMDLYFFKYIWKLISDRMTKLEQGRNSPTSQAGSFAQSYADIVGTTNSSTNVNQTPPPAECLEKLEYISNKEERRKK